MATVNIKASFNSDIETIWNKVTSLTDCLWRSDISKIELGDSPDRFTEYTKSGYSTNFTITAFEPHSLYEFDMDNDNMHGHWRGIFSYSSDGKVYVDFTEEVYAKKFFMKPFIGIYLKKQQAKYIEDLHKALEG